VSLKTLKIKHTGNLSAFYEEPLPLQTTICFFPREQKSLEGHKLHSSGSMPRQRVGGIIA
jgi:hypothetical protein